MKQNVIYNLVLEIRPGDNAIIDINSIPGINIPISNEISTIDFFTCKYSEEELRKLIEENNIVEDKYLNGKFRIISTLHHNLPILTKERAEIIFEFQKSTEEIDRSLKDKLYGYYKKIIEQLIDGNEFLKNLEIFKNALNTNNKLVIFDLIEKIPYNKNRTIYFMLQDEIMKRKEEKIRKLEKPEDVL